MKLKFGTKVYTIEYHPYIGDGVFGETDSPSKRNRKIRIVEGQSEKDEFGTYLHEFLHAEFPFLSEEAVEQAEKNLETALFTTLRYRRTK